MQNFFFLIEKLRILSLKEYAVLSMFSFPVLSYTSVLM